MKTSECVKLWKVTAWVNFLSPLWKTGFQKIWHIHVIFPDLLSYVVCLFVCVYCIPSYVWNKLIGISESYGLRENFCVTFVPCYLYTSSPLVISADLHVVVTNWGKQECACWAQKKTDVKNAGFRMLENVLAIVCQGKKHIHHVCWTSMMHTIQHVLENVNIRCLGYKKTPRTDLSRMHQTQSSYRVKVQSW